MYQPQHFVENRPEALHALMRAAPLATLVVPTADGLVANPLPLMLRPGPQGQGLVLAGHVARANPVWKAAATGEALAVFGGVQGYVSPNWYPSKAAHGKAVPTWNYMVVHAHGLLRWIDDAAWLRGFLAELTHAHEGGQEHPWQITDAPEDFITQTVRAIVGLELQVTRLEGKFKLSQNRGEADRQGVIDGLQRQGDPASMALAEAVRAAGGAP
jgi:transcriptional regulator